MSLFSRAYSNFLNNQYNIVIVLNFDWLCSDCFSFKIVYGVDLVILFKKSGF